MRHQTDVQPHKQRIGEIRHIVKYPPLKFHHPAFFSYTKNSNKMARKDYRFIW